MQIVRSDVVSVRGSKWRVANVDPFDGCRLFTLVGVESANRGVERRVLSPFDIVGRVERRVMPKFVRTRIWRSACRALIAKDTPPGGLQSPLTARIDLLPHQLEPALSLVSGLGTRVLLADDVGLGKTVQAGLIASELKLRGAADRILVVTPAGLRDQWAHELRSRFGLAAAVVDVQSLRQTSLTQPVGANPWQAMPVAIASVDYIKRPDVLADLSTCQWDLLIVDEAHGVAGESDRHMAVAALAARVPFVVLVTATPHSGDRESFSSLCEIGSLANDRLLVFRRSRQDIGLPSTRKIRRLLVKPSPAEARMHRLLAAFAAAVRRERGAGRHDEVDAPLTLALSVLFKRAWSSARSLERSVARRLAALQPGGAERSEQLALPLVDATGETSTDDEPPPWSPLVGLRDGGRECRLLQDVLDAAQAAASDERKLAALRRWLRRTDEPVVIFTEYRDTLINVQACLDEPSLVLHGGLSRSERRLVLTRFTKREVRILLATDAAGEGLNLHHVCRLVINIELPWNPMRLEQRIGRVDRIGQARTVHALHLIGAGPEMRMLDRLEARMARARIDMNTADPLGQRATGGEPHRIDGLAEQSLREHARSEAGRLQYARSIVRPGDFTMLDRLITVGPCRGRARRWKSRAAFHGKTLTLWHGETCDGTGRSVDSTTVAIAHQGCDIVEPDLKAVLDAAIETRLEKVASVHRRFVSTRVARERAVVAARSNGMAAGQLQPGLFDRRAERESLAATVIQRHADAAAATRLHLLERAETLSVEPPHLLLMLTAR